MRVQFSATVLALALLAGGGEATAATTPLAQSPTLNGTQIVFTWGDHLWSVPRSGGTARRLTAGADPEGRAFFSPDGKWIAYSSIVGGNGDAYVIPAEGGTPRRLTFHPGADKVVGWTPDGKSVLLSSARESYALFERLYTVPFEGGPQQALPMWRGVQGSYSADASRIAYVPNSKWQKEWKRYRGGQATPIWLARLGDLQVEKIPRDRSNDSEPVWVGDIVYFLSDRDGPVSLYSYDTRSKAVKRLIDNHGLDLKTLAAGPDALVYEQFGSIHLYSPTTGRSQKVDIRIEDEPEAVKPQTIDVTGDIETVSLSPRGDALVIDARGDVLTADMTGAKPVVRNLTATSGVHERDPAWSADGRQLAYFSDETGEYALHIRPRDGGPVRKITVGDQPTFLQSPRWSPDGRYIVVEDAWENLWRVEVATGASVKVAAHTYAATWSPDGRWLAYSKPEVSSMHAVWLYSTETGVSTRVSGDLADARWPVFDKNGRVLLFAVSTDLGLSMSVQDMSGMNHPVSRSIWAAVLRADDPAPLDAKAVSGAFRVDLAGIDKRVVALPITPANYSGLIAGKPGVLFLEELPIIQPRSAGRNGVAIKRFDFATGALDVVGPRVSTLEISADGEKALYRMGRSWFLGDAAGRFEAGAPLDLGKLEVRLDPRAEWREMFRETWRHERDFFYDPGLHGLDLAKTRATYAPFVEAAGSQADVIYLFSEMLGDLTVGHMAVGSNFAFHLPNARGGGLLGADFSIENDRYRIKRIYDAGSWNLGLSAPLAGLGSTVKPGDYLLAVNDQPLDGRVDLYRLLEGTAGKPTHLKIAADAAGRDARDIVVTPTNDEFELRVRAWGEDNRRRVETASGGRIAYVAVPDAADNGFTNFNRYYFAQVGKQAAIIDARFNTGGRFSDYIVDMLRRPLRNCAITRASGSYCVPGAQIYGPKTMLTNEMSGSGGDALPWMFKQDGAGALVGTRTWGGLIGGGGPSLIDGTGLATPFHAHFGLKGEWEVENIGVTPDYEVENDPASVAAGGDPQLEKAIAVTLEALKAHPVRLPSAPPAPRYVRP
jgi:tricorn protease